MSYRVVTLETPYTREGLGAVTVIQSNNDKTRVVKIGFFP
jgi:hypothetical protein